MNKRGRPRSEAAKQSIFAATLRLVDEIGYAQTTMDKIAAEAKVGKQTLYRWWTSKGDVLLAAVCAAGESELSIEVSGSFRKDMEALFNKMFSLNKMSGMRNVLKALMAESQYDVDLQKKFRRDVIESRKMILRKIFRAAQERKEIREEADIDFLIDIAFGIMWYRLLTDEGQIDESLFTNLSDLIYRQR